MTRNCRKYEEFLPLHKDDAPKWWSPEYVSRRGTLFALQEVSSNECPVSINHNNPELQLLVQQFVRARSLQKSGIRPDPRSLAIPLADAFVILGAEEERAKGAVAERDSIEDKFASR